jgi:hypothetical protein
MNTLLTTRNVNNAGHALLSSWALAHDTTAEDLIKSRAAWKLWCYVLWVGIFCLFVSASGMWGLMSDIAQHNDAAWQAIMIVGLGVTSIACWYLFTSDRRFVAFNEDYKKLYLTVPALFSPMSGHPSQHDVAMALTEIISYKNQLLRQHNMNLLDPYAAYYEDKQHVAAAKARNEEMQEAQRLLRIFCGIHT